MPLDECASKPCLYGGTCVDGDNGFTCKCPAGLTGTDCSVREDVCASKPCGDTGTCFDGLLNNPVCVCKQGYEAVVSAKGPCKLIDYCAKSVCKNGATCSSSPTGFSCKCVAGYTGTNCDNEINECTNDPCDTTGTTPDGCRDLPNGYMCSCKDGFSGHNCEHNIDECASNPCYHGGICRDKENKFVCDCPLGWEGARCDVTTDNCQSDLCQNDAKCHSIFANYYCQCQGRTFGKNCSLKASICQHGNPCVGKSSLCHEDVNGTATCECASTNTGDGCELTADYCSVKGLCKNGGTCKLVFNGYKCHCADGFQGDECETPVKGCSGVTCKNSGTCISSGGHNYCECPVDKEGHDCDRAVDDDYDMFFHNPGMAGLVSQAYPFVLKSNAITIGMWVRLTNSELSGTVFFTLYGLSGWIVLGCQYDTDNYMCKEGAGFDGYLSRVEVWNRVLSSSDEIPTLAEGRTKSQSNGRTLRWTGYVSYTGMTIMRPSTAGDVVQATASLPPRITCPDMFHVTNSDRQVLVNWTEPKLTGDVDGPARSVFANNKVYLWGGYRNTYVVYDKDGNADTCSFDVFVRKSDCSIDCRLAKGSGADGANLCPIDSAVTPPNSWPHATFNTSCGASQTYTVPVPAAYTCGPRGTWNPWNAMRPLTWPKCTEIKPQKVQLKLTVTYKQLKPCSSVKDAIAGEIRMWFKNLNKIWGTSAQSTSKGFCSSDKCKEIKIDVKCGPTGRRRRRAAEEGVAEVTVDDVSSNLHGPNGQTLSPEDVVKAEALDSPSGLDFSGDTYPNQIPNASPDLATLDVKTNIVCQEGQVDVSGQCVDCAEGTYYKSGLCEPCPVGQYQDQPKQTTCKSCRTDFTTENTGTVSPDLCYKKCSVGQYYDLTTSRCQPCVKGFYQDEEAQFTCKPCPVTKSTDGTGSISQAQCIDLCQDGTEAGAGGSCQDCPRGEYRRLGFEPECTKCPTGWITPAKKSVSKSDCTVPDCQPGEKISGQNCTKCPRVHCRAGQEEDPSNPGQCRSCPKGYYKEDDKPEPCKQCKAGNTTENEASTSADDCRIKKCPAGKQPKSDQSDCELCPRGTYQPEAGEAKCISCSPRKSTKKAGALKESDCEAYCKDGELKDDTGSCVPCPRGYYKNNTEYEFACTLCPIDFITPHEGAQSEANCTIRNCTAGYHLDNSTNTCKSCSKGYYQDKKWQETCIKCNTEETTEEEGSDSKSDCKPDCDAGREGVGGKCEPCKRGYNKEKKGADPCTLCTNGKITSGTGATGFNDCTIANCTAGEYLDETSNTCIKCKQNYYQPEKWKTVCLKCPSDKITDGDGHANESDCVIRANYFTNHVTAAPHDQNPGSPSFWVSNHAKKSTNRRYTVSTADKFSEGIPDVAVGCNRKLNALALSVERIDIPVARWSASITVVSVYAGAVPYLGTFAATRTSIVSNVSVMVAVDDEAICCPVASGRSSRLRSAVVIAPVNNAVINNDAASSHQRHRMDSMSSIEGVEADCRKGTKFSDTKQQSCTDCPRGWYQDELWQDECKECPDAKTTPSNHSTSLADCKRDCSSGFELDEETGNCVKCRQGFYKDQAKHFSCQPCPSGKTTSGTGSTAESDCTLGNCTAGEMFDGTDCKPCPVGQYQDEKYQTECKSCGSKMTTASTGAKSKEECKSTDACVNGKDNCATTANGGTCTSVGNGTVFTCGCRAAYELQPDKSCRHKCDNPEFCLNGGTCSRDNVENPTCVCTDKYEGERCDIRSAPQTNTPYIIGGSIGGFLLLIAIFVIGLCICSCMRSPKKDGPNQRVVPFVNPAYEPLPSFMKPPTRYPAGSVMSPASVFAPRGPASHAPSMSGYNTGGCLFYEEPDDEPVRTGGYTAPSQISYQSHLGQTNKGFSEASNTMTFQD
ncbi:hypothetical protein NP493_454g00003 [Ridgeia piscesae]|uniref:Uncharacterized protein n=1 Tax=Ridgeia piscesae TaxID=27915 RepID=A0AAD9L096_RIDPI|nr:hypothetical protein NP493_454g00003 [Ridgeia piscesae]